MQPPFVPRSTIPYLLREGNTGDKVKYDPTEDDNEKLNDPDFQAKFKEY